jgi:hypothetical protein
MLFIPNTRALVGDAPIRFDGGGFGHHDSEATKGKLTEVH